jgi:Xaa-Pro aminopeptidase
VNGTFSAQQRQVYDIVLAAQLAAEAVARELGAARGDLSDAAVKVIAAGLAELGLIESADATLPSGRPQYTLYYLHGLGHGIGLDVHDPNSPTMEVGYAFTIEPGLYIREDALDRIGEGAEADALRAKLRSKILEYKDIGVRIEDSYVYTESGLVRLSEGIPRTPDEVEAMMSAESFSSDSRLEELVEQFRRQQGRRE